MRWGRSAASSGTRALAASSYILLLSVLLTASGCDTGSRTTGTPSAPCDPRVALQSVSPVEARPGTTITLIGLNFFPEVDRNQVTFVDDTGTVELQGQPLAYIDDGLDDLQ